MQETIVFTQGVEMPPDIVALASDMAPEGFSLQHLPVGTPDDDIAAAMREAEYLLGFVRHLPDEAFMANATRLKLVQVLSAGYDQVNIAGARAARVPVCSNGGANSVAVAEHAIMLMLAVYRNLVALHQNVVAGKWHSGIPRTVNVYELAGKTVGLVGLGNIGQQVAQRVRAFDASVIYHDAFRRSAAEEERLGVRYVSLETLLETADVVSLHVPLNHDTRDMMDAEALARMKPTAILINTCRGEVVDEGGAVRRLAAGPHPGRRARHPGAGTDRPVQSAAYPAQRGRLTPHSAGPTVDSFRKRFHNGYANIRRVAAGEPPLWVIPEMHDLFPQG